MLIAIMGDTFDRSSEVKEQSALKEKIDILSDYVVVVGRESVEKKNLDRFIFAVEPTTTSTDEISNWEGTVTSLKQALAAESNGIKSSMHKRIGNLSLEVSGATQRLTVLDDKMSELQGNQERLSSKLISIDSRLNDMQSR